MTDIALQPITGTTFFDWDLNDTGTDLAADSSFLSAVLMSFGTDRLANADDVIPDGTTDRRGTWMDDTLDGSQPTDRMGSRLWELSRVKASAQVLNDAIFYCNEALQWMLDDQLAGAIDVTAAYQPGNPGVMVIDITISRIGPPGGKPVTERYQLLWDMVSGELASLTAMN